jgi:hypothetical protein
MAIKLAELSIIRAVAAVAVIVIEVKRVIVAVITAAAIYRLVYFYSSFYSVNAY